MLNKFNRLGFLTFVRNDISFYYDTVSKLGMTSYLKVKFYTS